MNMIQHVKSLDHLSNTCSHEGRKLWWIQHSSSEALILVLKPLIYLKYIVSPCKQSNSDQTKGSFYTSSSTKVWSWARMTRLALSISRSLSVCVFWGLWQHWDQGFCYITKGAVNHLRDVWLKGQPPTTVVYCSVCVSLRAGWEWGKCTCVGGDVGTRQDGFDGGHKDAYVECLFGSR